MKTIQNILYALFIVFICSCTKDDTSTTPSGSELPSKIVSTYSGGQVSTSTFTYSGNKIVEELILPAEDVSKIKYTYTGDNITKTESFISTSFSAFGGKNLTYENGKVKTIIDIPVSGYNGNLSKKVYSYNTDGTVVTVTSYSINQTTKVETVNGSQEVLTCANGNLTKSEWVTGVVVNQTTNYTYDSGKNQAFKNITGFDQTLAEGNLRLSTSVVGDSSASKTFSYTYNANNYPS